MKNLLKIYNCGKNFFYENFSLIKFAILFFALNQLFEYLLLLSINKSYTNLCTWDCDWYSDIVKNGYDTKPFQHPGSDAANWAFFPILPIFAATLTKLTILSAKISLLISSKIFFLLAIFSFIKFCQIYNPTISPIFAAFIISFNPYSIYGNSGYTEPIFLFFTCLCFCLIKNKNYLAGSVSGAILSATRFVGVFMFISYVVLTYKKFSKSDSKNKEKIILGALIIPIGLGLFMTFLYFKTGDVFAFSHVAQKSWGRNMQNPLMQIINGLKEGGSVRFYAITSIVALLLCATLAFQKHYELFLFSLFATIIPISTGLTSIARYVWWQAPLLLTIATLTNYKKIKFFIIPLFLFSLIMTYILWTNKSVFMI